jgi:hypothetical protein
MRLAARLALLTSIALVASAAVGQDETRGDDSDSRPAPPAGAPLDLDKLLNPRVESSRSEVPTRPGGKDRDAWQREFANAYTEVRQLREKVDASQRKMREAAGDANYSYSPAGATETFDPEVLKARAQIQRDRQSLQAAERRLRDLKVEASLAGVPADWQVPPPSPEADGD